jgi:hypothetical protein
MICPLMSVPPTAMGRALLFTHPKNCSKSCTQHIQSLHSTLIQPQEQHIDIGSTMHMRWHADRVILFSIAWRDTSQQGTVPLWLPVRWAIRTQVSN